MKKPIFDLVDQDPASATCLIYFLLQRLGGSVTFKKSELDTLDGADVETLVDLSMNEDNETLTLEIHNDIG